MVSQLTESNITFSPKQYITRTEITSIQLTSNPITEQIQGIKHHDQVGLILRMKYQLNVPK